MTREEVLNNRKIWIEFLKAPARKKTKGKLESFADPEARCCLGHGCAVLGIPKGVHRRHVVYDNSIALAPKSLIEKVGLFDNRGSIRGTESTLATFNDSLGMTPQEIGQYLETRIEGGEGTPFRSLLEYVSVV